MTREERKWLRIQYLGLSMWLSLPFVVMAVGMVFGFTLSGEPATSVRNILAPAIIALGAGGFICLEYGHDKRKQARKRDAEQTQEVKDG